MSLEDAGIFTLAFANPDALGEKVVIVNYNDSVVCIGICIFCIAGSICGYYG